MESPKTIDVEIKMLDVLTPFFKEGDETAWLALMNLAERIKHIYLNYNRLKKKHGIELQSAAE